MLRDATISPCGRFRYQLWRNWAPKLPTLLFVMLNPSTADALVDDATIRRCIFFAKVHGFGSIEVVNLFAFRTAYPPELRRAGFPVGPDNDRHITEAASRASAVCVAWGAVPAAEDRIQVVLPLLRAAGHMPQCLGVTFAGFPRHPGRLPNSSRLHPLDAAVEAILR